MRRKKIAKPKVGSLVRVVFVDHCMSAGEPELGMKFEVVGRLTHSENGVWVVRVWGNPDNLEHDANSNSFSIVESTILEFKRLA